MKIKSYNTNLLLDFIKAKSNNMNLFLDFMEVFLYKVSKIVLLTVQTKGISGCYS